MGLMEIGQAEKTLVNAIEILKELINGFYLFELFAIGAEIIVEFFYVFINNYCFMFGGG